MTNKHQLLLTSVSKLPEYSPQKLFNSFCPHGNYFRALQRCSEAAERRRNCETCRFAAPKLRRSAVKIVKNLILLLPRAPANPLDMSPPPGNFKTVIIGPPSHFSTPSPGCLGAGRGMWSAQKYSLILNKRDNYLRCVMRWPAHLNNQGLLTCQTRFLY